MRMPVLGKTELLGKSLFNCIFSWHVHNTEELQMKFLVFEVAFYVRLLGLRTDCATCTCF